MTNEQILQKIGYSLCGAALVKNSLNDEGSGYILMVQGELGTLSNQYRLLKIIEWNNSDWEGALFFLHGKPNAKHAVAIQIADLIEKCIEA